MLAADAHTAYLSEPLNVLHRPGVFAAPVQHWYTHINSENESTFLPAFRSMLGFRYGLARELRSLRSLRDFLRMLRDLLQFTEARFRRKRPLIKDPFAVFSAPWFAERLGCQVVITIRHPAGFASSLKRLGWPFRMQDLLDQQALIRDLHEADRREMESLSEGDIVGQAALLWRMIYGSVARMLVEQPGFILVRQEDLALDPLGGFGRLYRVLDLGFTPDVERSILRSSSSDNPDEPSRSSAHSIRVDSRAALRTWHKRLDADEIARIRNLTGEISAQFYSAGEWD